VAVLAAELAVEVEGERGVPLDERGLVGLVLRCRGRGGQAGCKDDGGQRDECEPGMNHGIPHVFDFGTGVDSGLLSISVSSRLKSARARSGSRSRSFFSCSIASGVL